MNQNQRRILFAFILIALILQTIKWYARPTVYSILLKKDFTVRIADLAQQFERELRRLQEPPSCDTHHALYAGNSSWGLGSQIHHSVACFILSNAKQIPCIHDPNGWAYNDTWNTFLKPIWSNCSLEKIRKAPHTKCDQETFRDVLWNGMPIPKYLGQLINETFENEEAAVLWTFAQYAKFVFQLNSKSHDAISTWRQTLNISSNRPQRQPLIGIHVRLSDKKIETAVQLRPEQFMEEAQIYRRKLIYDNVEFDQINVFIASEDHNVLTTFRNQFSGNEWNFVGFSSQRTYGSPEERYSQLLPILRDISILLECDYVICTFSSNVCRLLLELKMYTNSGNPVTFGYTNTYPWIKSLDGIFFSDPLFDDMPLKFVFT